MVGTVQPFGPNGEPSAIRKQPVSEPLELGALGLAGDEQAWHTHGGTDKAMLHHAAEHYELWARIFPERTLRPGCFGENLFTRGMTEESVCVGDRYRIGRTVMVEVSQPRQPCWKLSHNAGEREISRLMQEHAASGWYYRVIAPGAIRAGDEIELTERVAPEWPLARLVNSFYGTPLDEAFLREALKLDILGEEWRSVMRERLATGAVEDWDDRLYGPLAPRRKV